MREESRDRIVAAALELFARRGFAATSVRMTAERAGVAQGLLYNYFESKDALLQAIFDRSMADVRESFEVAESDADPSARLERLVRAALEIVDRNREFWRLSYQIRMQPEVLASLGEDVVGWAEATRAHLESLLRDAGAAQHYVLDPENYPVDDVCREIVARFTPAGGGNGGRPT